MCVCVTSTQNTHPQHTQVQIFATTTTCPHNHSNNYNNVDDVAVYVSFECEMTSLIPNQRLNTQIHPHQDVLDDESDNIVSEELSRTFSIRNSEGKNLAARVRRVLPLLLHSGISLT